MRFTTRILLSLISLATTLTYAQTIPPNTFSHIIIVIQENRTPDNLFGAAPGPRRNCVSEDPFELGVDIDNGGYVKGTTQPICNSSQLMNAQFNPDHTHAGWGLG